MIYLGIDGGGTRTRFLALDEHNRELARTESGPSNWVSVGGAIARNSLQHGIQQLQLTPDVVCGGFAGAARAEAAAFYIQTLREFLPRARLLVETDAFIAYVGAHGLVPGVLLIAGTGSIAISRTEGGEMIRVGGWGAVFGDEGSGHWIGREAIRMALRSYDSGEDSDFLKAVTKVLGLASITDLVSLWAAGEIGVPAVAAVAAEVIRHYPAPPADRILSEAAVHLRELVEVARHRIGLPTAPLSVTGSIGSNPLIQNLIGLPFAPPQRPPEYGAIVWARTKE